MTGSLDNVETDEFDGFDVFALCDDQHDPTDFDVNVSNPKKVANDVTSIDRDVDVTKLENLPAYIEKLRWNEMSQASWQLQEIYAKLGFRLVTFGSDHERLRLRYANAGVAAPRVNEEDRQKASSSSKCNCRFRLTLFKPKAKEGGQAHTTKACEFQHTCEPNPLLVAGGILYLS